MPSVLLKVTARRDDFGVEQAGVLFAFDFAEVWALAVPQQRFEQGVILGAADIHLDVAAAGCATRVVGGATGCRGARIRVGGDREWVAAW